MSLIKIMNHYCFNINYISKFFTYIFYNKNYHHWAAPGVKPVSLKGPANGSTR